MLQAWAQPPSLPAALPQPKYRCLGIGYVWAGGQALFLGSHLTSLSNAPSQCAFTWLGRLPCPPQVVKRWFLKGITGEPAYPGDVPRKVRDHSIGVRHKVVPAL